LDRSPTLTFPARGGPSSVAFSPNGKRLAFAVWHRKAALTIIDPSNGKQLAHRDLAGFGIAQIAYSPDGQKIASMRSQTGTVEVWDARTLRPLQTFNGHTGNGTGVGFGPDGRWLASACESDQDLTVRIWSLKAGREQAICRGHQKSVQALAIDPAGRWLASASYDRTVRFWNVTTGRELFQIVAPNDILSLACRPDGNQIAVACFTPSVPIIDVQTRKTIVTLQANRHVHLLQYSPDGHRLVTARSDHPQLEIWDTVSGRELLRSDEDRGGDPGVHDLAFSPDGRHIATADGHFDSIRIWSIPEADGTLSARAARVPSEPKSSAVATTASSGPRWVSLLDSKYLAGWTPMRISGPSDELHQPTRGGWAVRGGELVCATDESGWLKSREQYSDFVLQLEYKLPPGGNSVVYVRSPGTGHLWETGMAITILDGLASRFQNLPPENRTGGIWGAVGPRLAADRPAKQWNRLEIQCQGEKVQVNLNGVRVLDVDTEESPALCNRPRVGYIGFSNWHGEAQGTVFRNIRIKPL
jgi:WD40 repeat protein